MDTQIMFDELFYTTIRLVIENKRYEALLYLKRNMSKIKKNNEALYQKMITLFDNADGLVSERGIDMSSIPVDSDSRMMLLRQEFYDESVKPVWDESVNRQIKLVIEERNKILELNQHGLTPVKSLLFYGPPGVGKTLAAKWISYELKMPCYTLDLSSVMSSFLGRTGSNVRSIFDFARDRRCVLFLDELDAIAKKRDDVSEIGELKRLVTVLLQEIDNWNSEGLLIAATNHPDILDVAVWRRFDNTISFKNPSTEELYKVIQQSYDDDFIKVKSLDKMLPILFLGKSYSDVTRIINGLRKEAFLSPEESLMELTVNYFKETIRDFELKSKKDIALNLISSGISQRKVSEITGLSRDTIRKTGGLNNGT